MSGGVDSSVAALLLKKAGHEVIGVSMHLYSCNRAAAKSCCTASDRMDARRVCERLGIPFVCLDYREQFRSKVIEPFADAYLKGLTPSPCILCNRHLKFDSLFEEMGRLGADALATGHYARVESQDNGHLRLLRGADRKKDQSYFLFPISRNDLSRICFPLGNLTKQEVRRIAKENGLPTSDKKESQEICFVPDGDYASFIEAMRPSDTAGHGNFVDSNGNVLGRHRGIHAYTIGQRRGLGFGIGKRQFVVSINAMRNEVVLGDGDELMQREMILNDLNWFEPPDEVQKLGAIDVQIRSGHKAARARVELRDAVRIIFDEPQRAIAPGQAAVLYSGDEVLGGGWIV